MSGDFNERMDEIAKQIGEGILEGIVEVDQVYARYQDGWGDLNETGAYQGTITPTEESHGPNGKPGPLFDHPRGGHAGYLSQQLTVKGPAIVQKWVDTIAQGGDIRRAMVDSTTDIATGVQTGAPRQWWILRNSAAYRVKDNNVLVMDRPALIPRMTQEELNALRAMSTGDVSGANGEVMTHSLWNNGAVSRNAHAAVTGRSRL